MRAYVAKRSHHSSQAALKSVIFLLANRFLWNSYFQQRQDTSDEQERDTENGITTFQNGSTPFEYYLLSSTYSGMAALM